MSDSTREADLETRQRARTAIGVTGVASQVALRQGVAASGVGWYPLVALGLLVVVDEFATYGLLVLGPEVSRGIGVSKSVLAGLAALGTLAVTLAALPMAGFVQRSARRGLLSIVTAYAWSALTLLTGFVTSTWGLAGVLISNGASTGSVRSMHTPLLMDTYPPHVRVRALSAYRAADSFGNIAAPLLVGLLTAVMGFTWRGVFVAMGILCFAAAVFGSRLQDPGYGRWDTAVIRREARAGRSPDSTGPGTQDDLSDDDVRLGFFEIVRRLMLIPSIRHFMTAGAVFGMLLTPLYTYLFFFLEDQWGMGPGARGLFFGAMPLFSLLALAIFARRGDAIFASKPSDIVRLGALCLGAGVVALALAIYSPVFVGLVILFGLSSALFAIVPVTLNMAQLSIVPATMRPHLAALQGIFIFGVGGFSGLVLLGGIDRRFGTAGAIASLAIPGIVAAAIVLRAARSFDDDLNQMIDHLLEEEEVRALEASGARVPMLSCRHLDFSYGQVQVLFDVNFTVDDGEAVALLGTNGAGKSTLLKAISGIGLVDRGSIRYRGVDVTYLDAERRLRLGVSQVPGGKRSFPTCQWPRTCACSATRSAATGRRSSRASRQPSRPFRASVNGAISRR